MVGIISYRGSSTIHADAHIYSKTRIDILYLPFSEMWEKHSLLLQWRLECVVLGVVVLLVVVVGTARCPHAPGVLWSPMAVQ